MVFTVASNLFLIQSMRSLRLIACRIGNTVGRVATERELVEELDGIDKLYLAYRTALGQRFKDSSTKRYISSARRKLAARLEGFRARIDSLAAQTEGDIPVAADLVDTLFAALSALDDDLWRRTVDRAQRALCSAVDDEQRKADELIARSRKLTSRAARYGVVLLLSMTLLSVCAALVIARRIARPIAHLREATHYARLGKYNRRVPLTTRDEIADLAADFNAMMDALGKLEKMKAMFLASITHDLKSPLYRVKLGLENLVDGLHGELSQEQRDVVARLMGDVETLSRLIHDILDLQKLEDGKFDLRLESVELAPFIRDTVRRHAISFADKGVGLTLRMDVGDVVARIDKKQMERVFENLLSNALKFTPKGGKVTVTAAHRKDVVHISVADTGPGIPPDEIDKVFDKFFSGGKGRGVGGTGLGLAIAKQIITAHGGRIWAESKPGSGATFHFVLPVS